MGESVFIVGGARSGKSHFAEKLAEDLKAPEKYYIATCPVVDSTDTEMVKRIGQHKKRREGKGWQTIEEQLNLCRAVEAIPADALILIDCLTLWVSNLLYENGEAGVEDEYVENHIINLFEICGCRPGVVLLVSGEVGCSVVPENSLARRFRDLVGRCNQTAGRYADKVFMVTCGIPNQIKG